ncbi:hypothetical protein GCM10009076_27720 [Erythrobacter ramosus]
MAFIIDPVIRTHFALTVIGEGKVVVVDAIFGHIRGVYVATYEKQAGRVTGSSRAL